VITISLRTIFNWIYLQAVLFYLVWFAAVKAAGIPESELAAIVLLGSFTLASLLQVSCNRVRELQSIIAITVLGSTVDAIIVFCGYVSFPATSLYLGNYPLWMIGMWTSFATLYSTGLYWMRDKKMLQILFGALGGPLSLYAATALGAVTFPRAMIETVIVIGLEWGAIMPMSWWLYKRARLY
jgi:hypothetical protein